MLAVTGNGTPALKNIETNRYPAEKTGGPCCETMGACLAQAFWWAVWPPVVTTGTNMA